MGALDCTRRHPGASTRRGKHSTRRPGGRGYARLQCDRRAAIARATELAWDSQEFLGNQRVVTALRGMLREAACRTRCCFPARAASENSRWRGCSRRRPTASACPMISAASAKLACASLLRRSSDRSSSSGLAQRGERPDAATVERVPLLLETHPDVWAIVPDPVRLRSPWRGPCCAWGNCAPCSARPAISSRRGAGAFSDRRRGNHAPVLSQYFPENPGRAARIGHADFAGAQSVSLCKPPSVRAALQFHFAPAPGAEVESILAAHGAKLKTAERRTVAQYAEGSPGAAIGFRSRQQSRRCIARP